MKKLSDINKSSIVIAATLFSLSALPDFLYLLSKITDDYKMENAAFVVIIIYAILSAGAAGAVIILSLILVYNIADSRETKSVNIPFYIIYLVLSAGSVLLTFYNFTHLIPRG